MKPLKRQGFHVERAGAIFSFLVPSALLTLRLRRLLPREGGGKDNDARLEDGTANGALLLAYVWDPQSELGDLDSRAGLPDLGKATDEQLAASAVVVLDELSAAGLSFSDLGALSIAVIRRMFGSDVVGEAGKTADFTPAR